MKCGVALRRCFSFWSQSQKNGVGRHGRRGLGRNAVPSSALFLGRAAGNKGKRNNKEQESQCSKRPTSASMESVTRPSSVRTANRRTDFRRTRTMFRGRSRSRPLLDRARGISKSLVGQMVEMTHKRILTHKLVFSIAWISYTK